MAMRDCRWLVPGAEQSVASERPHVSLASGAGRGAPASEPVGESEGRRPSEEKR
jgi:hypothetical protein